MLFGCCRLRGRLAVVSQLSYGMRLDGELLEPCGVEWVRPGLLRMVLTQVRLPLKLTHGSRHGSHHLEPALPSGDALGYTRRESQQCRPPHILWPQAYTLACPPPEAACPFLVLLRPQGKKHQIRRMVEQVSLVCTGLHRTRVGGLTLEGLEAGRWRFFELRELEPD
jgi:hypothetical protein